MSTPESGPALPVPEPLPESVKAAHRRKLALATAAKQAGAQTQPDRSAPEPASTVPETCPEPRLAELEAIVEKGLTTFIEVGNALAEIRDSRLYRQTHKTFEDYCRERWNMVASRARQLIGAAQIASNLESVTTVTPTHESQVRPLAKLEPDQQREAWKAATEATPTPTAEEVARVAESFDERRKREESETDEWITRCKTTTQGFKRAVSFFDPKGHAPKEIAEELLEYINPALIEWRYSKYYLRECIQVLELVVKGLP